MGNLDIDEKASTSRIVLDLEMDPSEIRSPFQKSRRSANHNLLFNPLSSSNNQGKHFYRDRRVIFFFVATAVVLYGLFNTICYILDDPTKTTPSYHADFKLQPSKVTIANITYLAKRSDNIPWDSYFGLPYGEAPVGEYRMRQARPFPEVNKPDVLNATVEHMGCPRLSWFRADDFVGVEDCLRLDVHTPSSRPSDGSKLPVMVWIHGGSFYSDSTVGVSYPLDGLLSRGFEMNQPFIAVRLQYRLGILGFSSDAPKPGAPPLPPHIPTQPPDHLDLNVGLKDQILALQWIKKHIAAFGGDPDHIVLVGHEAGAISISMHMLYSPRHLFAGAFLMSGAATSLSVPFPHDAAHRSLHPLGQIMGCPDAYPNFDHPEVPPDNEFLIKCIRGKTLNQIMQATIQLVQQERPFPWYPVLEGKYPGSWLNVRPSDRLARASLTNRVPTVIGTVRDEGTRFVKMDIKNQQDVWPELRRCFDFDFPAIEGLSGPLWNLYSETSATSTSQLATSNSIYKRAALILGDTLFFAPARFFAKELGLDFGKPVYFYRYEEPLPGSSPTIGVAHGADLGVWFGYPPASDNPDFNYLSRYMMSYMVSFINNLDPNGPGLRPWAPYGHDHKMLHLSLRNISLVYDNDRLQQTKFINKQNPLFSR